MASHQFYVYTRAPGETIIRSNGADYSGVCRGSLENMPLNTYHSEKLEIHLATRSRVGLGLAVPPKVELAWHQSMMRLGIGTAFHEGDDGFISTLNTVNYGKFSWVQTIESRRATDRANNKYKGCRMYSHGVHINADWQLYRQIYERPFNTAHAWCVSAMEIILDKSAEIDARFGDGATALCIDSLTKTLLLNLAAQPGIGSGHFIDLGSERSSSKRASILAKYLSMTHAERKEAADGCGEGNYMDFVTPPTEKLFNLIAASAPDGTEYEVIRAGNGGGEIVGTDYNRTYIQSVVRWAIQGTVLEQMQGMVRGAFDHDHRNNLTSTGAVIPMRALLKKRLNEQ